MVVKSLKSYLHYYSEAALFFDIRTDLLYRYCFPISHFPVSHDVPSLDVLTFTVLLSDICHDIPDSYNYHYTGMVT